MQTFLLVYDAVVAADVAVAVDVDVVGAVIKFMHSKRQNK